ncbi:MAG TPA: esterase-like activity of phytase family protein [Synechococcales cyanobacterium M55_K2018_004]|nr:esterase-like activity of phytase family protein [Synechococcales cyanobacterium M55_K2018_004]
MVAALALIALLLSGGLLSGCSLPQVSAEDRLFLKLSVDFLGAAELPKTPIEGVPVGGLSGLVYDRVSDRFYAISDDRSRNGPARFYTLKLNLDTSDASTPKISSLDVERVTPLKAPDGQPYPPDSLDPEGIALSPRQTLYIASEGIARQGVAPFIDEFALESGRWVSRLPIPDRFLPKTVNDQPQGVQDNLGFEALTLNLPGFNPSPGFLEPFRLFAATEAPLWQDLPPTPPPSSSAIRSGAIASPPATSAETLVTTPAPIPVRLLHYLIGEDLPSLIAEHLYVLEPAPVGALSHGLSDILVLSQAGHFLSLERSFGLEGTRVQLFQFVISNATDTSGYPALRGDLAGIQPVRKRLLLDLNTLDIPLDNLEGLSLGPRLPDGSQTLLILSDDNFSDVQKNQVLLFRLRGMQ